jgi:multiple antibiotic resistance protein
LPVKICGARWCFRAIRAFPRHKTDRNFMFQTLIGAFVTLFVVIDPVGLGPIFAALTGGFPEREKRQIGLEAALVAFFVLTGTALFGNWLLARLGISLAAFRIAGGLLLFAIAFEMVFQRRQQRKADDAAALERPAGIAAFPLGIPLLAGPGALTAVLLLAGRLYTPAGLFALILIVALVLAIALLVFRAATPLERLLGVSGQAVFARLLGVLLASLSVQYVADGILALR